MELALFDTNIDDALNAHPQTIILATAKVSGRLIITRNPDDFPRAKVRVPYEIANGKVTNVQAPL